MYYVHCPSVQHFTVFSPVANSNFLEKKANLKAFLFPRYFLNMKKYRNFAFEMCKYSSNRKI